MRRALTVLVLALVVATPATSLAQPGPAIMRLSEVRPGMKGIGKTVVSGQRVDDFAFEVMDILQAGGGSIGVDRLILFRMQGPLAERTGGSAAGMSGSPLYINGKLIGALSASFAWQSPRRDIVLATPIEEMLKILERRTPSSQLSPVYHASRPHLIGGRLVDRVVVAPGLRPPARVPDGPGIAVATPAVAVFTRGLSPRANQLLADLIKPLGHEILQGHGGRGDFAAQPIVPGSSVGIQEARGDVDFGGVCTVTMRVGNRVLVCGHPWENAGDVEYALTASEILTVVTALPRPFKVGNLGEIIGIIDQDRGAGIAGTLGRLPRFFNIRVVVTDQETGTRVQLGSQVVRRRDMARLFAPLVALSATERARSQGGGEGTATVKLTLRAKGLPAPIVRENMFYSTRDVATASVLDIVDAMELAFYNDLKTLEPIDLTVETVLTKKRITASIVDVAVDSREVSPGGMLRVRVALQPYLAERPVTRVIEVPVPRDYPRGPAVLVVRSAGFDNPNVPVEARLSGALAAEPAPWGVDSLEAALRLFETFGKNTDILVRLQPFGLPTTGQDFTRFDVQAGRLTRSDWVIQGVERIPILIR
ncbi:MAG: SpoIVB peptidase S55 domain-containing protein [Armatimonadota bacterium]|nr:SpoIVB peptidase S55 domain-containing protein [Armatimonadota bacterium]